MTPVLTTQDGLKYGERNTDQCVQNMFNTRAVPSSNTLAPTIARQCYVRHSKCTHGCARSLLRSLAGRSERRPCET